MRARTVAVAVAILAGLDLMLLIALPLFGILDVPMAPGGSWTQVALVLAFALAALSLIGTLSILMTGRLEPRPELLGFEINCHECGAMPKIELAFCHQCGADA